MHLEHARVVVQHGQLVLAVHEEGVGHAGVAVVVHRRGEEEREHVERLQVRREHGLGERGRGSGSGWG